MNRKRQLPEQRKRRAAYLKQIYLWHWVSSAICLVGMVLFALTGITLNHASQIEAKPHTISRDARLPDHLVADLKAQPATAKIALTPAASAWLKSELGVNVSGRATEWSPREIYIALPRPGGDAWLSIARDTGDVAYEVTDRGWIAYLNDLHKGRHTGDAWSWYLDIFAIATIMFCLTGLLLLQFHSHRRPATWSVVGLGVALPVLVIVIFIHQ